MRHNRSNKIGAPASPLPEAEQKKRKRECIIIGVVIALVTPLILIENKIIQFNSDFPVSNTLLMFSLININLLLLLLLIFLVFRNLIKLFYDRKRKIFGAKLRTRLTASFVVLTLMPSLILFFFSINFITNSIELWFKVPIGQALDNSLKIARTIYQQAEINNHFSLQRIAIQIAQKNLLRPNNIQYLSNHVKLIQKEMNVGALEVYSIYGNRLSLSIDDRIKNPSLNSIDKEYFRKDWNFGETYSIYETVSVGELIRTISRVPFDAKNSNNQAFIVVTELISSPLTENIASITKGFEEYQQAKLLKKPIQITYYASLSVVALLVLFCAVWFGFYLAKTITIPILKLARGTQKIAEGDLEFTIDLETDDEIGSLVNSFNKMTRDLRVSRDQLEYSAQKLMDQNTEIEARRQYMEIVLKNVSAGVITLDADGIFTTFNTSAERMLSLKASEILEKSYKTVLKGEHLSIAEEILEKLIQSRSNFIELPLRINVEGRPRSFAANINTLKDETDKNVGTVMVIDDLTELEKAQRMAAWREVARRIAHEVKNPLTPIILSAQRLKRKYSQIVNEPVFEECIRLIIDHVELIRNLVNEFHSFARFPTANPKPCALISIIEETVALYNEGRPDMTFNLNVEDAIPILYLDREQIKRVMINLLENAVAAVKNSGTIDITVGHDPILKRVRIEVADDGPGISDEHKIRLFEPNFSTKKSGMGLGLTIVHSIVTDHEGLIRVQDNSPKGAKFVIELPAFRKGV